MPAGRRVVIDIHQNHMPASIIRMIVKPSKKGNVLSYRKVISLAAVAALGIACVATEAFAAGAARGGAVAVPGGAAGARGGVAYRGGAVAARGGVAYRGGAVAARGGYYRPGVGAAAVVGGAAIGAAAAYPYYHAPAASTGPSAMACAELSRAWAHGGSDFAGACGASNVDEN
jgi:hypothetical protein